MKTKKAKAAKETKEAKAAKEAELMFSKQAQTYTSYLQNFGTRIDQICELEDYRAYLRNQNYILTHQTLMAQKEQLVLEKQKRKEKLQAENDEILQEINSLQCLHKDYQEMIAKAENEIAASQKYLLKSNYTLRRMESRIKEHMKKNWDNGTSSLILPKVALESPNSSEAPKKKAALMGEEKNYASKQLTQERLKVEFLKLAAVFLKESCSSRYLRLASIIEKEIQERQSLVQQVERLL